MDKNEDMLRLELLCNLEQFEEAIGYLDSLIENKYNYSDEALVFVAGQMNENKYALDKAYQLIRKGLTLFPENISLKAELCLNLHVRGFQKEAMDLCRQLTEEQPFSVDLWCMQAELYNDCGDYENALESINYAISCAQDDDSLMIYHLTFIKARYLYMNESYYPAIRCFTELMTYKEYDKAIVDYYLASCYMHLNDYETAFNLLNGIIGQEDKVDEIAFYGDFIYCCLRTDRQIVAIDKLVDAFKLYPNSILEYLAFLSQRNNRQTEADIEQEKIIHSGELSRNFFKYITYYN